MSFIPAYNGRKTNYVTKGNYFWNDKDGYWTKKLPLFADDYTCIDSEQNIRLKIYPAKQLLETFKSDSKMPPGI